MKSLGLTLVFFTAALSAWAKVPVLRIHDTINPGTADYLIRNIDAAERAEAPYVVIELDTPGGLLTSTRSIVQKMLNTSVPIVVFVAPQGARATSAGALITMAADVAVMAPGTHIGAVHPVIPGKKETSEKIDEKITNDTASFAKSIAKEKGRNEAWAVDSVRKSASLIARDAVEKNVIDFIADNRTVLLERLAGHPLRRPKGPISQLPTGVFEAAPVERTVKQKLMAFFANPEIAYMLLSLGALCIWIELTHPGLIFPGVVGAVSIVIGLMSFQMLPISYGALALLVLGISLMIAELFTSTFGILGIGGSLCFVLGSLFLMDTPSPLFQISLWLIAPTALFLTAAAIGIGYLVMRSQKTTHTSGIEAMVGSYGEVRDPVSQDRGRVFVHGELWQARVPKADTEIGKGKIVVVRQVQDMVLVVELCKEENAHV